MRRILDERISSLPPSPTAPPPHPPPVPDEKARLASLARYGMQDTGPEQEFDDIVLLASGICETPIAIVSLIGADRQWFKGRIGLDGPGTPISQSVCVHGLSQRGLLVIPDLTLDPRTRHNTLVTDAPHLRFYAGARLETASGLALGMLCAIDIQPRPAGLRPGQASSLAALARQVMMQLEARRLAAERELLVQEAHHRVKNSLQMVQSLLSLQARMTSHPEAAQQLHDSAMRVGLFGGMHEHLYRVGAEPQVDLAIYLATLVADQRSALVSNFQGRDMVFNATSAHWPSDDAQTVGLVLMELVTNALKYGQGLITVTLSSTQDEITLDVRDEGTDLPPGFDPADSKGLGMRVLIGLLRSRQGRLQINRARPQTHFTATLRSPT